MPFQAQRTERAAAGSLDMALSLLISAWLVGALGGVHCLAMCGGFISAIAAREGRSAGQPAPILPLAVLLRRQFIYHGGRITTYTLLGAATGVAGALALDTTAVLPVQRTLYVVANVMLLLVATSVAFGRPHMIGLQRIGAAAFGALLPRLRPVLAMHGSGSRLALGLIWGLAPCALIYSVLPLALFAGGAWQGAAVMLAFGTGTLPNVLGAGILVNRAGRFQDRPAVRYAVATVIGIFAIIGAYRALWVSGALAQGPFCLVP